MYSLIGHISPAQAKVVLTGEQNDVESSSSSDNDEQNNKKQKQIEIDSKGKPIPKKRVQITRILPDPNISPLGHTLLALLFYGLFIAHIVISTMEYMNTPPTTTQSLVSSEAKDIPPLSVMLGVECKGEVASDCGDMLLTVNYTNYPDSACRQEPRQNKITVWSNRRPQSTISFISSPSSLPGEVGVFDFVMTQNQIFTGNAVNNKVYYEVPLCFTQQESLKLSSIVGSGDVDASLPMSMIQVGFKNLTGGAGAVMDVKVRWTGDQNENEDDIANSFFPPSGTFSALDQNEQEKVAKRLINVNQDHSVRILPIYGTVEQDLDRPEKERVLSFTPTADVIQFEGFRPSSSHRSDVMIVMQSMTTLRSVESVASLWDLVSNVGSAFETLMGFMPFVLPLWGWLFLAKRNWMGSFFNNTDKNGKDDSAEKKGGKSSKKKYEQDATITASGSPESSLKKAPSFNSDGGESQNFTSSKNKNNNKNNNVIQTPEKKKKFNDTEMIHVESSS